MNNVSVLDIKIHVIFRHVHYFRWSKIIRPKWNPTETRRDLSLKVAIIEPNTTTKPGWERKFMKFPHGKTNDEKSGHWKHDSKIACVLPSESLFLRSEGFFWLKWGKSLSTPSTKSRDQHCDFRIPGNITKLESLPIALSNFCTIIFWTHSPHQQIFAPGIGVKIAEIFETLRSTLLPQKTTAFNRDPYNYNGLLIPI